MKGRLLLGVAGILCAIIVAALVAPVLIPHTTQGSAVPRERLLVQYSKECSDMYGCTSVRYSCGNWCETKIGPFTITNGDCCPVGVDVGSCLYCED